MNTNTFSWPEGNRIAIVVSVMLETWSQDKAPSYFPRTSPTRSGTVDLAGIQWAQFGGNEGVWRIVRILNEFGVHGTFFCNGRSAEAYPEAITQIVKSRHDIAAQGYVQDEFLADMTPQEEHATIRKTLDILEQASGVRPKGWSTPMYGWTPHTLDFLAQEGVLWCADTLDMSLPRQKKTKNGVIVAFPWSDFVDNRVLRASPRDFYNVYKDTFDYLYAHEPMGLVHIGFHSHFGGRPLMSAMLHKVLQYFRDFPNVWFPRHSEIAQWLIDERIDDLSYARRFF